MVFLYLCIFKSQTNTALLKKAFLVVEYDAFDIFLDSVCCYFVDFFLSVIMRFFSAVSFLYLHNYGGASQVVLVVKNPPANAGGVRDATLIPGLGRSSGGEYSNPLQYSCLENPMDRGASQATVQVLKFFQKFIFLCLCVCLHLFWLII